ncbi:hypothetical protein DFQ28_009205 [Apophysomyces sp. BC1034]|nr:hypothetical protein DFQ28_009205 [Apophysomyces sp. BC1034]
MTDQNALLHCLERLHFGDDKELKERSEHFYSQCSNLVPAKVFEKGPNCKPVISIQIAYESLGRYGWDNKLAVQLSACRQGAYDSAINVVRKQLNLQPTVTFEALSVAFGCTTMLSHLSIGKRMSAQEDMQLPSWKAAVFYTCAKALGESIDKSKLQTICACNQAEIKKTTKLIENTCPSTIAELKTISTKSTRTGRKRQLRQSQSEADDKEKQADDKGKEEEKGGRARKRATKAGLQKNTDVDPPSKGRAEKQARGTGEDVPLAKRPPPISGIVSMINKQHYKKTKRYSDYQQWREGINARINLAL